MSTRVTIGALFAAYMEYARPRLKTCGRMQQTFNCYLSRLADIDAMQFSTDDVVQIRDDLASNVSAKTANNVTELLSTMYNRAIEAGTVCDYNPVRGLHKFALDKRDRMLHVDQLPRFFKALATLRKDSVRDYFLTCLLTGEQCGKVLEMRWEDIDLERGIWFIPQPKRQPRTLYLLPEMTHMLRSNEGQSDSPWVFPSSCSHIACSGQCPPSRSGHLEVRGDSKAWATLVKRAGLKDFRLNDLRNSRVNMEPVRAAMAEHYYAPLPQAEKPDAAHKAAQWEAQQRRRAAVAAALAAPVLRPAIPPPLELSPYSQGSSVPTFGQLFEYYMDKHGKHRASAHQMRGYFRRYLPALADRPADKIQVSDVNQLHSYLGEHVGRPTANRVLEILKAVYNKAIKWELIDFRNPAIPVSLFPLQSRDRFFSAAENKQLMDAMDTCGSDTFIAFIKTCKYTGARKGNVSAMRWEDIDREAATWRIPMTKNGKPHVVPLIPDAINAIESQRGKHREWVFPGRGTTGHIVNPARSWGRLRKTAGLENARMHDIRRTLGSWQCKSGASLPIIGKTLGHTNPRATQIYARLDTVPVRDAIQTAVNAMDGETVKAAEPVDMAALADMVASAVAARLQERVQKEK